MRSAARSGEPIGIAHDDPALAAHRIHQERIARFVEEEALVFEQREMRIGALRVGERRRERIEPQGLGPLPTRRAMDHRVERQARADDDGDEAAAQESRSVVLPAELPPEIVAVIHVLKDGETEPDGTAEDEAEGHEPARLERLRKDAGLAVEGRAVGQEQHQHGAEDEGLLPVEALGERHHHAGADHQHR